MLLQLCAVYGTQCSSVYGTQCSSVYGTQCTSQALCPRPYLIGEQIGAAIVWIYAGVVRGLCLGLLFILKAYQEVGTNDAWCPDLTGWLAWPDSLDQGHLIGHSWIFLIPHSFCNDLPTKSGETLPCLNN